MRATNHTDRVQETVAELNLFKAWDLYDIDFTSVHETGNTTPVSKIDHFFMNRSLTEKVEDAGSQQVRSLSNICCLYLLRNPPGKLCKKACKAKAIMEKTMRRREKKLPEDAGGKAG